MVEIDNISQKQAVAEALTHVERVHDVDKALKQQAFNGGLRALMGLADVNGSAVSGGLMAQSNVATATEFSIADKQKRDKAALKAALKLSNDIHTRMLNQLAELELEAAPLRLDIDRLQQEIDQKYALFVNGHLN